MFLKLVSSRRQGCFVNLNFLRCKVILHCYFALLRHIDTYITYGSSKANRHYRIKLVKEIY